MAAREGARLDALAEGLIAPVVLGGTLTLGPPLGPRELALWQVARIEDDGLRSRVDVARVRRARQLLPVDVLPELGAGEWAMAGALHDLLQVSNHELSGALTRGRHAKLLDAVVRELEGIPGPADVRELVARHATFARVMEVIRTDHLVSWWTGSRAFRGQAPPARLLAWRELRRVRVEAKPVAIGSMAADLEVGGALHERFGQALAAWLSLSPLTDLANASRATPAFALSPAALRVMAAPLGRTLALRAVWSGGEGAVGAIGRAAQALGVGPAGELARGFASELAAGVSRAAAVLR